jgi:hypothetical protein
MAASSFSLSSAIIALFAPSLATGLGFASAPTQGFPLLSRPQNHRRVKGMPLTYPIQKNTTFAIT